MSDHWKAKVTLAAAMAFVLVPASALALTIIGTNGDDVIIGSPQRDRIAALGGDDQVDAAGAADRVRAGEGNDRVGGGEGPDRMSGGPGDDTQAGGEGDDHIYAWTGADVSFGGPGNDHLWGRIRADVPADGVDELHGEEGNDLFLARDGEADLIDCGEGRDIALLDPLDVIVDATPEEPDGSCEKVVRRPPRPHPDEPTL